MFLTVHATAGIIIAQKISNPFLAFIIGLISHYFLDAIPHGDQPLFDRYTGKKWLKIITITALIDSAITLLWVGFLFYEKETYNSVACFAAILGSVLPDFLNGFYILWQKRYLKIFWDLNHGAHHLIFKKDLSAFWGLLTQITVFALLIIYLFTT